jgi:very-short-patch-repair endonuclease
MDTDRFEELLNRQEGVVARWQLTELGATPAAANHLIRQHRRIHQGVVASGHAPLTDRQWWIAATLTTPTSALNAMSAGGASGFFRDHRRFATVIRPGRGGVRLFNRVLVTYCDQEDRDLITHNGIRMTSPARTVLDLVAYLGHGRASARVVRDALRLGFVHHKTLMAIADKHHGRPGVPELRRLAKTLASLPATRTRSDAELLGAALIVEVGLKQPQINVRRAGFAADLSWPEHKLIIELDGPQFHSLPGEDEKRNRAWRAAGWTVVRISTDVVYDDPAGFVATVAAVLGIDPTTVRNVHPQ